MCSVTVDETLKLPVSPAGDILASKAGKVSLNQPRRLPCRIPLRIGNPANAVIHTIWQYPGIGIPEQSVSVQS